MSVERKRILYFFIGHSTFVKKEIDILSKNYDVINFDFAIKRSAKWMLILLFLKQFIFLLTKTGKSKLFVCQFSGYHTILPVVFAKIFRKKSLIISGGTDCVSFPSIGYGNFNKPFLRWFTAKSFKLASHIAPKHETLWFFNYNYENEDFPAQGISYFLPGITTPHTSIPNGYDTEKFSNRADKKENVFVTVTGAMEYPFQKALKGIDLILEVAPFFPEYKFIILGVDKVDSLHTESKNVVVLPKESNDNLINFYSKSKFYLQLSMAEGFPNALCEAMLCECVPIVSNVFSMPEIIDNSGFILMKRDLTLLKETLTSAINSDTNVLGKKARELIVKNYSLKERESKLSILVDQLMR